MSAPRLIQAIVAGVTVITTGTTVAPYVDIQVKPLAAAVETAGPAMRYMPLTAGRKLTYETADGGRFSLTFGPARQMEWFDGTTREVVPVADTRCECKVLLRRVGTEVRAVGSFADGRLHQWGEYITVFPGSLEGAVVDPVETPAGAFWQAVRLQLSQGPVWYAPGVGIVKTRDYQLIRVDG